MLKLTLHEGEYLTINENIVIQVDKTAPGKTILAVDASRDIPIVRGKLLERAGQARPGCLDPR